MINIRSPDVRIRLASSVNVLSGLWLLAAPRVLTYTITANGAAANDMIIGAAMVIFGLARVSAPRRAPTPGGINFALGFWTLISPWVYGFSTEAAHAGSSMLVGIIVMLFAGWSTTMTLQLRRRTGLSRM
jgi:hypothetical protein